jgi:hypothetical protein
MYHDGMVRHAACGVDAPNTLLMTGFCVTAAIRVKLTGRS